MNARFFDPSGITSGRSPCVRGRNWLVMNVIMQGMQIACSRMSTSSSQMPRLAEHFGHYLPTSTSGHRLLHEVSRPIDEQTIAPQETNALGLPEENGAVTFDFDECWRFAVVGALLMRGT